LKVLIVTTSYPCNDADPSGIFIKRLALAMVRSGATVTVLAPGDRHTKSREVDNGIDIVRFFYAPRILMRIGYGEGGIPENVRRWPWLFLILPFFLLSLSLHTIVLAKDCDVVHANWLATGFFCLPAKWIRRKPLVVTLRGSDLSKVPSKLLPFSAANADAITTVNQSWAESLAERFPGKVFYTPNGVEVSNSVMDMRSKYGFGSHETIALYVGALRKVKGADLIGETAKRIVKKNPSVKFLVIGPGNPGEFGLCELTNVICTGSIPPHEVLATYSSCDIFVLPSRFEGRPNALLEAMASGLPSVVTKLPGVIEVISEESGILVDTEDPEALALGICTLAKDPARRQLMGERAKAKISELSLDWESSAKNYLHVFNQVRSCAA
jgi:glycosyltransferase involved in cell wall biosynthesis